MAKQESIIEFVGTIGKMTFYKSDGKYYVKKKGGMSRERILNDPELGRIRENMSEFGGAAQLAGIFRQGLSPLFQALGDRKVSSRFTGLLRKVNGAASEGKRGQRPFHILANKRFLERFECNRTQKFGESFRVIVDDPVADANRGVVTWTVPDFHTEKDLYIPKGATHVQLILASKVLSDYEYNENDKGFALVEPELAKKLAVDYSAPMAIGDMVGGDTVLSTDLGLTEALPDTVGVVNFVGIQFYQEVHGELSLFQGGQAMQLINVV